MPPPAGAPARHPAAVGKAKPAPAHSAPEGAKDPTREASKLEAPAQSNARAPDTAPLSATGPAATSFGGKVPTVLLAADPGRRWAALCQASADSDGNGRLEVSIGAHGRLGGDRLQPLLIDARGTRIPIERFLGALGERYVAFVAAEQLWLLDLNATTQRQLSQAAGSKRRPRGLVVAIDSERGRIAHVERNEIVLHDLVTDRRASFPAPDGLVRSLSFEADGQLLSLEVVTADSNGNGRLDAPRIRQGIADSPCQGPIPNYAVSGQHSDSADVHLLHLATGELRAVPGFVLALGERWIRRGPDRELVLESAKGAPQKLASPRCNGRVLHTAPAFESVLLGCAEKYGMRRDLYLRTPSKLVHLRLDLAAFEMDGRLPSEARWVGLSTRDATVFVDMAQGTVRRLPADLQVLATGEPYSLVEEKSQLGFVTASDAAPSENGTGVRRRPLSQLLRWRHLFAVGSELFDLERGVHLGRFASAPWALSKDRYGLLPSAPASSERLGTGPLQWQPTDSSGATRTP